MSEDKKAPTEAANAKEENKAADAKDASTEAQSESKGPSFANLSEGLGGILGVKAGMTQVYDENGQAKAVTVIQINPNKVTQKRSIEKDGYQAVQVGVLPKKESKATRSEKGHVKKSGGQSYYQYQEFRMPKGAKLEGVEPGTHINADFIKAGDLVDLCGVSKGKGFQGVMKRYHFRGGPATHGASIVHRMPGSIGQRTDPGKVWKGKKMAGHMGHKRVTVQNVRVERVDLENNILLVNGSVPGPKSSIVSIRKAVKGMKQSDLR